MQQSFYVESDAEQDMEQDGSDTPDDQEVERFLREATVAGRPRSKPVCVRMRRKGKLATAIVRAASRS